MVFFMGGPQLGELEAGVVANWLGAPFSVVSGGIGCLAAVAWVAGTTPALRHYGTDAPGGAPRPPAPKGGYFAGANSIVISGSRFAFRPGTRSRMALASSGVCAACSRGSSVSSIRS